MCFVFIPSPRREGSLFFRSTGPLNRGFHFFTKLSPSGGVNGGGLLQAAIGLSEYLSQSNHNADCVEEDDRYEFVNDLPS